MLRMGTHITFFDKEREKKPISCFAFLNACCEFQNMANHLPWETPK